MISEQDKSIAERAKRIYAERLQKDFEKNHANEFVAIEPDSGEYFLGDTFSQAVAAARKSYPDRISFVIRIGHSAAIHIGGLSN